MKNETSLRLYGRRPQEMTLENKGFGQVWQGVLSGMIPGRRSAKLQSAEWKKVCLLNEWKGSYTAAAE